MSESQEGPVTPEGAEPTAEQRQLSRRSVVRAGLVAVPILMTLPVVPAWASPNTSTYSTSKCDINHGVNSAGQACNLKPNGMTATPSNQSDPFGASPFSGNPLGESPFKKP